MQHDLSHINKQIQKNTLDIEEARRQGTNQRRMADQKSRDGASDASYYEQEAIREDHKANQLQEEIEQLTTERDRIHHRISELETQREQLVREHESRLSHIDTELKQLQGSGFML